MTVECARASFSPAAAAWPAPLGPAPEGHGRWQRPPGRALGEAEGREERRVEQGVDAGLQHGSQRLLEPGDEELEVATAVLPVLPSAGHRC